MTTVIEIVAIVDNRMLADSLRAWAVGAPDIRLTDIAASVSALLEAPPRPVDVVLLDAGLRAEPNPAVNVGQLIGAGHRVLVIDASAELNFAAPALAAGAHGYLTRDHGLAALAATLHGIAAGGTAWSLGPTAAGVPNGPPPRPPLSRQEHAVLVAYASGQTLHAIARHLGISVETARTYLKRVKAKYQQAGLPVHTKLDLAEQVRADCTGGACPRSAPAPGAARAAGAPAEPGSGPGAGADDRHNRKDASAAGQ